MDVVTTDIVTGRATGLGKTARLALRALNKSRVPYSVIGAAALAVRGVPRMTRDLDVTVPLDRLSDALAALATVGLRAGTPTGTADDPEAMVVCVDPATGVEVDVLGASGEPETRVIAEAPKARCFGVRAPVATAAHLLLLYLYSNQPRHLGDFAALARGRPAAVKAAEATLAGMHREMLPEWRRRVADARTDKPRPPRPPRRRG